MIQFDTIHVGGLRWVRLGRLSVSVCVSREFQAFGAKGSPKAREAASTRLLRRRLEARELAGQCAAVFGCVVLAGLPLVLGGVI